MHRVDLTGGVACAGKGRVSYVPFPLMETLALAQGYLCGGQCQTVLLTGRLNLLQQRTITDGGTLNRPHRAGYNRPAVRRDLPALVSPVLVRPRLCGC